MLCLLNQLSADMYTHLQVGERGMVRRHPAVHWAARSELRADIRLLVSRGAFGTHTKL
jgi:hypothetical protein